MKKLGLWLILFSVAINRLCSWMPANVYFDPFPFYDIYYLDQNIGISLQAFIYYLANHLTIISIWIFCLHEIPKYSILFRFFIVLEVIALLDYLLIYEHAWFHIGFYGVEFTDIKLILYTSLIILWKHGKL
jgi:hypothetical protein